MRSEEGFFKQCIGLHGAFRTEFRHLSKNQVVLGFLGRVSADFLMELNVVMTGLFLGRKQWYYEHHL